MKRNFSPWVSGIIVAGGSSRRMNGTNKILYPLHGIPVIAYSMIALESCPEIQELIVVCQKQDEKTIHQLGATHLSRLTVHTSENGATRQQSVFSGISATSPLAEYYAIHDGARPFVRPEDISVCIKKAVETGAATLGIPVKDTIKITDQQGQICSTPDRSLLYAIQTPQVFASSLYKKAQLAAINDQKEYTDDNQLIEALGVPIQISPGHDTNIKLTTMFDLKLGEEILNLRKDGS